MSEILGEARILIRPDTVAFRAQLQEQLLVAQRSVKPVIVPVRFVGGGTGSSGVSKQIEEQQALAGAQNISADRVKKLSAAEREEARAAAAAARAHEQFGRGIGANLLSMLGLRGATLAASSAFIGGAAAAIIATKAIGAASDRTEQLNKSVEVFVASAPQVKQWAQTTATSMGISETAALSAASTFGELFRTLNVGPAQAAQLSESLVKLASDLASFNNVSTGRALQALQSGLVGQARPLRELGVFLTEARVKQEAFAETGKRSADALTQQDKILARYSLIMQDASIASGDFQRTQGRLANQSRILGANIENLAADIGTSLLPVITGIVVITNKAIEGLEKLPGEFKKIENSIPDFLKPEVGKPSGFDAIFSHLKPEFPGSGALGRILGFSLIDLAKTKDAADSAGNALTGFARDSGDAAEVQARLFAALERTSSQMNTLAQASTRAGDNLLKLQAQGATPSQQLPAAQQQLASDQAILAQLLASPEAKGRATAIRKIRQQIVQDRAEIKSLQGDISSAAQQAADAAQKAATDAKNARDKQDQAFLDILGGRQNRLENQLLIAQGTQSTSDDIRVEKALIAFFNSSLQSIKRAVAAGKLSAAAAHDAIQTIISERIQAKNDLKQLQASQAQTQIDNQQQILQLNIQIAQANGNKAAQERADEAYIKFLDAQIKAAKGNRVKIKQLILERAQTEADLKDLKKQTDDNTKAAQALASAEFNFLQTQTGFVSNLLGNLIPGGATAGLVGGSGGGPSAAPLRQVSGGFEEARTHAQASGVRGPSQGQAETTNSLLRRILAELHRANQGADHPEATHQRRVGAAVMDFQSASPGF